MPGLAVEQNTFLEDRTVSGPLMEKSNLPSGPCELATRVHRTRGTKWVHVVCGVVGSYVLLVGLLPVALPVVVDVHTRLTPTQQQQTRRA